jgi:hypothetical protein
MVADVSSYAVVPYFSTSYHASERRLVPLAGRLPRNRVYHRTRGFDSSRPVGQPDRQDPSLPGPPGGRRTDSPGAALSPRVWPIFAFELSILTGYYDG